MGEKKLEFGTRMLNKIRELQDSKKEVGFFECPICGEIVTLYRPKIEVNFGVCKCTKCNRGLEGRVY